MQPLYFTNPNRELVNELNSAPASMLDLYDEVATFGEVVESRTGNMKELLAVRFTIWPEDVKHLEAYYAGSTGHPFRRINPDAYCIAQLTGIPNPDFKPDPNAPVNLDYANSIKELPRLIEMLTNTPDTRQAVQVIGNGTCFTSFQLLNRSGKLHLVLNARSVHLVKGLPGDIIFWNRYVLQPAAKALHLTSAALHFSVGSLHFNSKA